jgi:hypothetical protein
VGDALAFTGLAVTSAFLGYGLGAGILRAGVFAEPLWLQVAVFLGFQCAVTGIVLRRMPAQLATGSLKGSKIAAFLDPAQRSEIMRAALIFVLCPLPHAANLALARHADAVIEVTEHRIVMLRGTPACRFAGSVRARDGSLLIGRDDFPLGFTADAVVCRRIDASPPGTAAIPATIEDGPLRFVTHGRAPRLTTTASGQNRASP